MELRERMSSKGPKRILSIDSGGILTLITLGFLEQIEQILRDRHQKSDLKLCEYFDLIGGSGSGAILAAMLAVGKSVEDIRKIFEKMSGKIFNNRKWGFSNLFFKIGPVENEFKKIFKDVTLGSPEIRTGLCIVTKRADTYDDMNFVNHHQDPLFNQYATVMIRKMLCASIGSIGNPVPETVIFEPDNQFPFIDGYFSMNRNPAWQIFQTASLQSGPFRWSSGEDKLLLISVGSGIQKFKFPVDQKAEKKLLKNWFKNIPLIMSDESSRSVHRTLMHISRTLAPQGADTSGGCFTKDILTAEPALTYLHYDVILDENIIRKSGIENPVELIGTVQQMKMPKDRGQLIKIGDHSAKTQIQNVHFPETFDLAGLKPADLKREPS